MGTKHDLQSQVGDLRNLVVSLREENSQLQAECDARLRQTTELLKVHSQLQESIRVLTEERAPLLRELEVLRQRDDPEWRKFEISIREFDSVSQRWTILLDGVRLIGILGTIAFCVHEISGVLRDWARPDLNPMYIVWLAVVQVLLAAPGIWFLKLWVKVRFHRSRESAGRRHVETLELDGSGEHIRQEGDQHP